MIVELEVALELSDYQMVSMDDQSDRAQTAHAIKDYSGLLEIVEASISANDDYKLRGLARDLRNMIEHGSVGEQQRIADQLGQRVLDLL